ncbi:pyridoxal phosphate-dependent aminotransferase [Ochrobactrum sp. Marseille-Q0166]|uniref:pyridoxal phosphate-dependent aminotransferase n=1 Tax=Ochrobactrum sp. Marseille-Q0166 TaxID=2761105 RepID=UPI0016563395|nr:pyridoxal phosphate-dependent aminotransferase [Ochrobactrum sp. Marseille-Q0166]MBC8717800.1 pyridoxal phosphate-dependent aminotransferase [Ochrobactrum sp. Marseille-Q0166]
MTSPRFTPLVETLPSTVPFVGPETLELQRGRSFSARIGANESSFGPAPSVIEAMKQEASEVWKYGDPENYALRHAIAAHHGVTPENIMPGAGVDALLGLVVRQYVQQGDKVINSLGGYPTFNYHVAGFGGTLITVPYNQDRPDLDALIEKARQEKPALLYIANPDNPMGTWHEGSDIQSFIERIPETTMLILDEAYCETGPVSAFPPFELDRPNILRMRTFSKAYGLAGIRVGYVVGNKNAISAFNKVRDHFAVNRIAQAAAIAALKDQDYLHDVVGKIHAGRERIAKIAVKHGLKPIPSATNFVTIDCGNDGSFATAILNGLIERDIFVRKPGAPVLDRCIRVSVGTSEQLDLFEEAFPAALFDAQKGF